MRAALQGGPASEAPTPPPLTPPLPIAEDAAMKIGALVFAALATLGCGGGDTSSEFTPCGTLAVTCTKCLDVQTKESCNSVVNAGNSQTCATYNQQFSGVCR